MTAAAMMNPVLDAIRSRLHKYLPHYVAVVVTVELAILLFWH